jgi:hypothetical protein
MEASVATLHKTMVEKIVLLANFAPPFPHASDSIVECFQKCRIFVVFCLECLEAYCFDFLFFASWYLHGYHYIMFCRMFPSWSMFISLQYHMYLL